MSRACVPTIVLGFVVVVVSGCFSSQFVIPTGAENRASHSIRRDGESTMSRIIG
jgi:hypothetical protein